MYFDLPGGTTGGSSELVQKWVDSLQSPENGSVCQLNWLVGQLLLLLDVNSNILFFFASVQGGPKNWTC